MSSAGRLTDAFARRALERSIADRHAAYTSEMQRIVDAAYDLIERTGNVDPSLRDVLRETGLSTQAFYRYFRSKDELLLLLLDDGRRRLLGYLDHRIAAAATPEGRLRAWVEGVLAQAAQPAAAGRTRPFVANQDRLADAFPDEQQVSVDLLVEQVGRVLAEISGDRRPVQARRDARAAYMLTFGMLHAHLSRRTQPSAADADHVVRFILGGIGR